MQAQEAKQLALSLMDQHGLIPDWRFGWFENDAKTLGVCLWDRTDRQIKLNLDYVDANADEHVKETILHEIAHALTVEEEPAHGPAWRKKCKEIGAIPRAFCYDSQSFAAPPYFEDFPLERFSSGESNLDNLLDGTKHGRCRWCGTKMPKEYPKDGHALEYRCCSAICQLLYGYHIGYFILPTISGKIDFEKGLRLLILEHGVEMHRKRFPTWFREEGSKQPAEGYRHCANETNGRHALPRQARANQNYCDRACQQAAHRARKASQGAEGVTGA